MSLREAALCGDEATSYYAYGLCIGDEVAALPAVARNDIVC